MTSKQFAKVKILSEGWLTSSLQKNQVQDGTEFNIGKVFTFMTV